jgi:transketolase
LPLSKLVVLYDDNHISIDGPTSLADSTNARMRFEAAGWKTDACDGQNAADVHRALDASQASDRPVMIACRTTIGFGAPSRAGTAKAHGEALGPEEVAGARQKLNWPYEPFVVPDDILSDWRKSGSLGKAAREEWLARKSDLPEELVRSFEEAHGDIPARLKEAVRELKRKFSAEKPAIATRKSSELALDVINPVVTNTIGGSADLTGSNNTRSKEITPTDFSGRYIHYGVREHGMAAAMSGMALHGGIIPYGGTFLVFSDYCRPSIRLAALMGLRAIYVMTHDSIGLGEDGPTHQPIEQLAALRAMPNLLVFRPADAVETAECWELALEQKKRPSLLALTRQNLPTLRTEHTDDNRCAKGAYELAGSAGATVSFLATGSEVEIALKARDLLAVEKIAARVVSMPCWGLFEEQPEAYRKSVLGDGLKIGIEAAAPFGWDRYIGGDGRFVGMHSFGASGPYKDVYKHFNITPEAAADAARAALKRL